jgi:hypothetical protein
MPAPVPHITFEPRHAHTSQIQGGGGGVEDTTRANDSLTDLLVKLMVGQGKLHGFSHLLLLYIHATNIPI